MPNHCAFYHQGHIDIQILISKIQNNHFASWGLHIADSSMAIVSDSEVENLIKEEFIHDKKVVNNKSQQHYASMSSGEKKMLLLHHVLSIQVENILLIDFFQYLDQANRDLATQLISEAGTRSRIIQIESRLSHFLPFVSHYFNVDSSYNTIYFSNAASLQLNHSVNEIEIEKLPQSNHKQGDIIVQMKNVSVTYDSRPIFNQITWQIRQGEFWHLKGSNGAGKTTLVGLITGDNPKAYGMDIQVFDYQKGTGEDVWQIKKQIGYCNPDMLRRFDRMHKIHEMIEAGFHDSVGLYRKSTDLQKRISSNWIRILGLENIKNKYFCFATPSQQRLTMLARALVKAPQLLILDEPTTSLPDQDITHFNQIINRLALQKSTSIIYISHSDEPSLENLHTIELIKTEHGSIAQFY
jgi:molybdate transport system ATP-binding protein